MTTCASVDTLQGIADRLRRRTIDMLLHSQAGHPGGSLSAAEVLVCLYFRVLRIDPARPDWPERDRLILSKGHAAPIYYACLMERGYFSEELLATYDELDSCLQGHPDCMAPGVDVSSGSLGQGLSIGVGMALGARLLSRSLQVYVLLGDGEVQEGQVWEAAMAGAKYKLDHLTAVVDCNGLQVDGYVDHIMPIEPLADKWRAFGWHVIDADGHSIPALLDAFDEAFHTASLPSVILARTVKGKGVSFMENNPEWHSKVVTQADWERALQELGQ